MWCLRCIQGEHSRAQLNQLMHVHGFASRMHRTFASVRPFRIGRTWNRRPAVSISLSNASHCVCTHPITVSFSTNSASSSQTFTAPSEIRQRIPSPLFLHPRNLQTTAPDRPSSHTVYAPPSQPLPRDIRVTFLGTASGRPTRARNVSSTAVWLRNHSGGGVNSTSIRRKKVLMFDCGDGTLLQSRHVPHLRDLIDLEVICLTHMHGDHAFGLPTVIAAACNHSSSDAPKTPLHVFGPQGISAYVKGVLAQTKTWMERPVIYHEILKGNVKTVGEEACVYAVVVPPTSHISLDAYSIGSFLAQTTAATGCALSSVAGSNEAEFANVSDAHTETSAEWLARLQSASQPFSLILLLCSLCAATKTPISLSTRGFSHIVR